MQALQEYGADMIELGIPYSDPIADGPVIQQSNAIALSNGMNLEILFSQLKQARPSIQVPIVLMGYLNPVLQFGFERFCKTAEEVGVDGIILPDLPLRAYDREYQAILKKYNLDFIFLVTPETPESRVKELDNRSSGFLYAVTSSSTTGSGKQSVSVENYLQRLSSYQLRNPVLAGFGIRDRQGFEQVARFVQGGIIGSAYISALAGSQDVNASTKSFLAGLKG
jgi:tryptophan synthase alpha chain